MSGRTALVAMSGGVDSSVAAALALEAGYEVVGATLRLWGGESDSGCCSVSDVEDARSVARALGIDHHVFDFSTEFGERVVEPYVAAHAQGSTPNPCIECNRHLKFDRLLGRASRLGFDVLVTGHHARIGRPALGAPRLLRGVDPTKDQSYVLSMLTSAQLERIVLPVGEMLKTEVRNLAARLALPTASKPDSLDTCFIPSTQGRDGFLSSRIKTRPGRLVDRAGAVVGSVDAVELVTVGQRRGLGPGRKGERRYALSVDVDTATVTVGSASDLGVRTVEVKSWHWVDQPPAPGEKVEVQASAHGEPTLATIGPSSALFALPRRRVAPGQTIAVYRGEEVLGSGIAR